MLRHIYKKSRSCPFSSLHFGSYEFLKEFYRLFHKNRVFCTREFCPLSARGMDEKKDTSFGTFDWRFGRSEGEIPISRAR